MVVVIVAAPAEQLVAHQFPGAVEVPDLPPGARRALHARGARHPGVLVGAERGSRRPRRRGARPRSCAFQGGGQGRRVLDGLAAALGQVLQHRVGGVPEQRDPPLHPRRDGQPVIHRPPVVPAEQRDGLPDVVAAGREALLQLRGVAPVLFAAPVGVAAEHRDLVVHPPAAQRVLHQVQAGPDPGDHVAQVGVAGDLLHGDGAAVGDVAGADGLVVAEHPCGCASAARRRRSPRRRRRSGRRGS